MARKLIDYESMSAYHRKAREHFAPADHEHDLATTEAAGLMSAEDKAKLDALADAGGSSEDFLTDEEFLAEVID